jgi:putative membrane protein
MTDLRVYLAAERTLLAWIRTGLAMMGFGFVVSRFALFLRELAYLGGAATTPPSGISLGLGTSLIFLGVAVNVVAAAQHVRLIRGLRAETVQRPPSHVLSVVLALAIAGMGLGMAAYLLILDASGVR